MQQTLPWGGNYVANWNNSRFTTNNLFSSFSPQLNSNLNVQYTQPFLRNFSIDGIRQQLESSKKTRELSDIQLTGVITEKGVTISPNKVGGGPVRLIISNQTQDAHTITLDGGNTTDTVGPINPLDTGTLQQTLVQGSYTVKAGSAKAVVKELKPGKLEVGPPRKNSSGQVLLP
jgi:hypothetical protein